MMEGENNAQGAHGPVTMDSRWCHECNGWRDVASGGDVLTCATCGGTAIRWSDVPCEECIAAGKPEPRRVYRPTYGTSADDDYGEVLCRTHDAAGYE